MYGFGRFVVLIFVYFGFVFFGVAVEDDGRFVYYVVFEEFVEVCCVKIGDVDFDVRGILF